MHDSNFHCENCGHETLETFIRLDDQRLLRCPRCDLFQKGILESETEYEGDYHVKYARRRSAKTVTATIRLGAARRYLKMRNPRILDIGCSVGATVKAAEQLGWRASGVDVSQAAVNFCIDEGLDCYHSSGVELPFADETFDLVTNWHVIEHVADIAETLVEWRRVLKPGGIMMIETPDSSYLKARLWGPERYKKFWPRNHLYTFNRRNLGSLLKQGGFEVLPTRIIGGLTALPPHLNGYAFLYRGYRETCRRIRLCKSFEIVCRRPLESSDAARQAA